MSSRRFVPAALSVLAASGAVAGVAMIVWATNRDFADNQRSWGYIVGTAGLIGAIVLAIIGDMVRGDDDSPDGDPPRA